MSRHDTASPRWGRGCGSVPGAAPGRAPAIVGLGHFDAEAEAALVAGKHRADADDLAVELLAVAVAHHQHHRVFPGAAFGRMADGAFHLQRVGGCGRFFADGRPGGRVKAQVVPAGGADRRALQDRGLAVRAGARGTCLTRPAVAHETSSTSALESALSLPADLPLPLP